MSEHDPDQLNRRARWRAWLIPVVAFGLALIAGIILFGKLRSEVWATYSDGAGVQSAIEDETARPVLWQDPEPQAFVEDAGADTGTLEAAFSADGTTMVLVHWDQDGRNADLFRSHWDGRRWSQPEAINSLNTKAAERSPALSHDGRYLYFASDREGGGGIRSLPVPLGRHDLDGCRSAAGHREFQGERTGPGPICRRNAVVFFLGSHRRRGGRHFCLHDHDAGREACPGN